MSAIPIPDFELGGTSSSDGLADASDQSDFLQDIQTIVEANTRFGDMSQTSGDVIIEGRPEDMFFEGAMAGQMVGSDDTQIKATPDFVQEALASGLIEPADLQKRVIERASGSVLPLALAGAAAVMIGYYIYTKVRK